MSKQKTKIELQAENNLLSASISHAIDIAANFQLYSYRVVDTSTFVHRTNELSEMLKKTQKENTLLLQNKEN